MLKRLLMGACECLWSWPSQTQVWRGLGAWLYETMLVCATWPTLQWSALLAEASAATRPGRMMMSETWGLVTK
eukprot:CAMPEP_0194775846 /NCGR_PEP_ID=MMETSP0323_2-20130528/61452_1 /TAXON_ID=2866 ORGANISM="Crypthecodinium cohnii, Strain Seligo" /NCGR_SAMPLE_ID=MMETSP0323_2 /ASSEMBLY_ACC=CAM_ASM_000346 /LENGTH=72 /DNA_ID=CAMNT_0039711993 /DNA_START=227 /DNA_END=443 /DNA_ORIENTATION=-